MENENAISKGDKEWQELESHLQKELPEVIRFFTDSTGLEVPVPKFKLSDEREDVEWYNPGTDKGTIFINPSYVPKGGTISYEAMLAHSYLHHVQYYVFFKLHEINKVEKKLGEFIDPERVTDLIKNFIESSAMFFCTAYITRKMKGNPRKDEIIKYLKSDAYIPPKGKFYGSNDVMLLAYSNNNYDIERTLKQSVSVDESIKIMKDYLDSLK